MHSLESMNVAREFGKRQPGNEKKLEEQEKSEENGEVLPVSSPNFCLSRAEDSAVTLHTVGVH